MINVKVCSVVNESTALHLLPPNSVCMTILKRVQNLYASQVIVIFQTPFCATPDSITLYQTLLCPQCPTFL